MSVKSKMHFLGGIVESQEEVRARGLESEKILLTNMEGNRWSHIVTNTNSWKSTQPFTEGDVLLDLEERYERY